MKLILPLFINTISHHQKCLHDSLFNVYETPTKGSSNGRNQYSFYSLGYHTRKSLLLNAKFSTKFQTKI
jgi:hypothetical protein